MALRDNPYLPLYVQDFLTDEKLNECSAESTGVYIRLMCLMHKSDQYGRILLKQKYKQMAKQNGKQISNFALQFAFQLVRQMPYDVETISRALEELMENGVVSIEDDVLFQKRMVRDSELSEKRSAAGSKGGRPSQSDRNLLKQKDKQNESKSSSKSEANTESEIESENKRKKDSAEREKEAPEVTFEQFWAAYPKKVGKGAAKKSWEKIHPDRELRQRILSAVARDTKTEQWQKAGGQYIPHPATWLNQERWEDEPNSVPPALVPSEPSPIPAELPDGKTWAEIYGDEPRHFTGDIEDLLP